MKPRSYIIVILSGLLSSLILLPAFASSLLPTEPTPEGFQFHVSEDTYVSMCVVNGVLCSSPTLVKGDQVNTLWNNCGIDIKRPDNAPVGSSFECRSILSVTSIPDGWIKMGDGNCPDPGCTFDVNTRSQIKLCDSAYQVCSNPITLLKNPGVHYICSKINFPDFTGVPFICIGKSAPPSYKQVSLPSFTDWNWWNRFKRISVPPEISDHWNEAIVWRDSFGRVDMAYGSAMELASAAMLGVLRNSDSINAWIKTQPIEEMTQKESDFYWAIVKSTVFPNDPPIYTTDTKLYWVASSRDFNILPIVGSIGLNIKCDSSQSVTNSSGTYYVVPSQDPSVKWTGATHLRVYAKCT